MQEFFLCSILGTIFSLLALCLNQSLKTGHQKRQISLVENDSF